MSPPPGLGDDPLAALPEPGALRAPEAWVERALGLTEGLRLDEGARLTTSERAGGEALGRFALGLLWADWACYRAPVDRAGWARMRRVVEAFPRGFRLWWVSAPGGGWVPVGYTGWYPICAQTFARLEDAPASITDRGQVAPLGAGEPDEGWVYVFNYSALPCAWGTGLTRALLGALGRDIAQARGLSTVCVSPQGARVAVGFARQGFEMAHRGVCVVGGCEEDVYTGRRGGARGAGP
jgi:hypothetical protein